MIQQMRRLPAICAEAIGNVIQFAGSVTIEAAELGENANPGSVSILAYNGGPLVVAGYDAPVYLRVEGITGLGKQNPLLRDHDKKRIIGTIEAKRGAGYSIEASGKLVGKSSDRIEVEELAADGFQWQASVGARPTKLVKIKAGNSMEVNGNKITGPAYVAMESRLAEVSLVTIGADADTQVYLAVAAEESNQTPINSESETLAVIKGARKRRADIEAAAIKLINEGGDIEAIETAMTEAISDPNVSASDFELKLLREYRRPQGRISSGGGNELRGRDLEQAVEASIMLTLGSTASDLEAAFDERVINAMDRHNELRHGLSLQDALQFAASQNRERVSRRDVSAMLRGAFPDVEASGVSTFTLSGIFSNIANKYMKAAFESVESAWREVSEIESVKDFKQVTYYALTGDMTYDKVAPSGELKHATVGEQSFTNQAETYGKLFSMSRPDIINDDMGALKRTPRMLGRGGALKLNDIFWTEFEENAGNFFHDNNNNLIDSGSASPFYLLCNPMDLAMIQVVFLNGRQMPVVEQTDADFKQLGIQMRGYHDFGVNKQEPRAAVKSPAALDIDNLAAAYKLFLDQTDYDSKPLSLMPQILLVSTSNYVTGNNLYNSTQIQSGNTGKILQSNPFAGKFRVVSSAYLTNA
jgi:hypothetical protein